MKVLSSITIKFNTTCLLHKWLQRSSSCYVILAVYSSKFDSNINTLHPNISVLQKRLSFRPKFTGCITQIITMCSQCISKGTFMILVYVNLWQYQCNQCTLLRFVDNCLIALMNLQLHTSLLSQLVINQLCTSVQVTFVTNQQVGTLHRCKCGIQKWTVKILIKQCQTITEIICRMKYLSFVWIKISYTHWNNTRCNNGKLANRFYQVSAVFVDQSSLN